MAKLSPTQSAHKLALRGDIDAAVEQLQALQSKADIGAHASLAEIAAYRGEWPEVLALVEVIFGKPSAVRTLNVYADMIMLTARAGLELSDWAEVRRLGKFALSKLTKKAGNGEAATRLVKYAEAKGTKPFQPRNEQKAQFEAALAEIAKQKATAATESLDHLFGLARTYEYYDGAVSLYDSKKALPVMFANASFAASALARAGRDREAWKAIEASLPRWRPVELTQVAPVVLLTDEGLRPLMTEKRCQQVLRTPRGPEATK